MFDTGNKEGGTVVTQQVPDFKTALESYNKQVTDLSVQIKAGQQELAELIIEIGKAKVDLQMQYNQKVSSLDDQISVLSTQLIDMQARVDSLNQQIQDKQATKDSISLDFKTERERLDASWLELHKSIDDYKNANAQLEPDRQEIIKVKSGLEKQEHEFEVYKADILAKIAKDADAAIQNKADANKVQDDALAALTKLDGVIDQIARERAALDTELANSKPILALAEELARQKEQNVIDAKANSELAMQNQQDANEIKVARVAIHNSEVAVANREATVTQAEQKIIGG